MNDRATLDGLVRASEQRPRERRLVCPCGGECVLVDYRAACLLCGARHETLASLVAKETA